MATAEQFIKRQVEAKYPALLFKQQLTAYVEKIYAMIRDNWKKTTNPVLGSCIQVNSPPPFPQLCLSCTS